MSRSRSRSTSATAVATKATVPAEPVIPSIALNLPVADPGNIHQPRRIDMALRGPNHQTFNAIRAGLQKQGARLKNGNLVNSATDVVNYILEQARCAMG